MDKIFLVKLVLIIFYLLGGSDGFSQAAFTNYSNVTSYQTKTEKEKLAYEHKVASKLTDFYNYLDIIGDPSVEKKLRKHTVNLVQKLFSGDVEIVDFLSESREQTTLTVFLQRLLKSSIKVRFSISNIHAMSEGIDRNTNYDLKVEGLEGESAYKINQLFEINLVDKQFGSKVKKVTVIILGKISE